MKKLEKEGATLLAPTSVVMVSCAAPGVRPNIITLAWVGTVCSEPPMLSIGIRPERHSHKIIKDSQEFVVNVPNRELIRATDYCGVASGREVDKFKESGLTPVAATKIAAPLIQEAPLNLECRVKQVSTLGTHDLFIAEVVWVHISEAILDDKGRLDLQAMHALSYGNGCYYAVAERVGSHGFSMKQS